MNRFPQHFELDPDSPQSQNLVLAILGNHPGGVIAYCSAQPCNDGTLTSMDPPTDWVPGDHGAALDLDGTNDYINVTHQQQLSFDVSLGFTISAWINVDTIAGGDTFSATNPRYIVIKSEIALTTLNYGLRILGGKIDFLYRNAADTAYVIQRADSASIDTGAWYHVAAVHAGSAIVLFTNGKIEPSTLTGSVASSQTNTASLQLGRESTNQRYFDGRLHDLRIYNRDLTDSEVWDLYSNPTGIILPRRNIRRAVAGAISIAAESGSYSISGTAADLLFDRVLISEAGAYSISGADASLKFDRILSAESGTYSITGADASLLQSFNLIADSGSYLLTGTAADLLADRVLTAEIGSYALTGSDATLIHSAAGTFVISAESGVYSISGAAADLLADRVISAEGGSYSLTGTDADLLFGFSLSAGVGAYTVSGTDANLLADRVLSAEAGSYALSGTDATLLFGFALAADAGAYSLTGTDATFSRTFVLSVGSGAYTVTGTSVTLSFSAATAGLSIYYAIMQKVQIDIQELSLVDIDSANIQLAKVQNERETIFPGLPGILVLPLGQETMPATAGTNERDDIGYPVAIVMFDIDRQDTGTGLPTDAVPGTQDEEFRFDRKLQWRERIRKKFINQRLDISSYVSGASIHNCLVEPGTVVDADDWLKDNIWTSVLVCRFLSRETRG